MTTKQTTYTAKTPEEKRQEIEQLTQQLEAKIAHYVESSENVLEHLRFMANFHSYSIRNMALIDAQFRGAQAVGSFSFWQQKGVRIRKGEKGIKILMPAPVELFQRGTDTNGHPQWVKVSNATAQEQTLLEAGLLAKRKVLFFKVGHVFEYTQTDAREKGLEVSEIFGRYHREGTVENDQAFLEAFQKLADSMGVQLLAFPPQELGTAKGAFYRDLNAIAMNPRNTIADTVPVMIHELAHAAIHNQMRFVQREKEGKAPLTTAEKEFQAEMVAYVVASRYGIPMERFSVPYLAEWTKGTELKEKTELLEEVRQTASRFIEQIDQHFAQEKLLVTEREILESGEKTKKGQGKRRRKFVEYER